MEREPDREQRPPPFVHDKELILDDASDDDAGADRPAHRQRPDRAVLRRGEAPNRDKLAEGEFTAPVLIELAASQNVDMPVSKAVAAILDGKVTIDAAIEGLLTRPFKAEE